MTDAAPDSVVSERPRLAKTSSAHINVFNPPSFAEPGKERTSTDQEPQQDVPTVLTKLKKWADYPSVADQPVEPTKFLPMKTPMSCEIIADWSLPSPPKYCLTVPLLLEAQRNQGRDVGMIIDLANHDCLYIDDVPPSVEYSHIQLVAKVLPPQEAIDEVEQVAKEFWSRHPDKYIAIHCAYGFNRTGFVVGSYLCQACGLTVAEALESFANARPPGVKHEKFVNELYKRYGNGEQPPKSRRASMEQSNPLPSDQMPMLSQASMLVAHPSNSNNSSSSTTARRGSVDISEGIPQQQLQKIHENYSQDDATNKKQPSSTSYDDGGGATMREPENESATTAIDFGATHTSGEVENGRTIGHDDYSEYAKQLEAEKSMRRTTSLGLAKALHNDFGHDNDRAEDDQQRVDQQSNDGSGSNQAGVTTPLRAPGSTNSQSTTITPTGSRPPTPPLPPLPLHQQQQQGISTRTNNIHTNAAPHTVTESTTTSRDANIPSTGKKPSMVRSFSVDSDNQSLGFGPLEALGYLKATPNTGGTTTVNTAADDANGKLAMMPRCDTRSELDNMNLEDWNNDGMKPYSESGDHHHPGDGSSTEVKTSPRGAVGSGSSKNTGSSSNNRRQQQANRCKVM